MIGMPGKGFNSRPHEEVDHNTHNIYLKEDASTHDLTKRSTNPVSGTIHSHYMLQLTTSRRGRPFRLRQQGGNHRASTHDLTKRSTAILHIICTKLQFYSLLFHKKPFTSNTKTFILNQFLLKSAIKSGANPLKFRVSFTFALKDQRFCHVKSGFYTYVFYFVLVLIAQIIEP